MLPTHEEGPDSSESAHDERLKEANKEPCYPDWLPWFSCGLFMILAVTFILLWLCKKEYVQNLNRRKAPALVNYVMEQRPCKGCPCAFPADRHNHDVTVDFVYLTNDMMVNVTKDVDKQYTLESAVAPGADAASIGTAALSGTNVSLYNRLTTEEGENLDSEDYRSAYLRDALHNALPQILEQLNNRKTNQKIRLVMDYEISKDEGCNWADRQRIIFEWAIGSKHVVDTLFIAHILPDHLIPQSYSSIDFDLWMDFIGWYERVVVSDKENFSDDKIGRKFLEAINAVYKAKFDTTEWTNAADKAKTKRSSERRIKELEKKDTRAKGADEKSKLQKELEKEKEELTKANDAFSKARAAAEAKDAKREAKDIQKQQEKIGKDGQEGLLKKLKEALEKARKHYDETVDPTSKK